MSDEKVLTKEIAEQFLANEESVDLSEFTAIEDEAAESLSKYEGTLWLEGLTSLSDAAANSLSECASCLVLNIFGLVGETGKWTQSIRKLAGNIKLEGSPQTGDVTLAMFSAFCGSCGKEEQFELETWGGEPFDQSTLESNGWGVYQEWSTDPVYRCPDCSIADPCPKCGDIYLIAVANQVEPICMLCETERLLKTLLSESSHKHF